VVILGVSSTLVGVGTLTCTFVNGLGFSSSFLPSGDSSSPMSASLTSAAKFRTGLGLLTLTFASSEDETFSTKSFARMFTDLASVVVRSFLFSEGFSVLALIIVSSNFGGSV
jgi:hypothetical protein